jgi:L-cysteine S-thiosulfotransferase
MEPLARETFTFSHPAGHGADRRLTLREPPINRTLPRPALRALSADDVYALTTYISDRNHLVLREFVADRNKMMTETPVNRLFKIKSAIFAALAVALTSVALAPAAQAQSAEDEGRKLAFDRGKGNCLTCHMIKGGDLPGTIGPELVDIKKKYPKREDLVAILNDETLRNPHTVMPPFGRNRILTEKEINAVVDFLQTL